MSIKAMGTGHGHGDPPTGPIVAIPPPPPALRHNVARLIVEVLARQALVDLGVITVIGNHKPPR